MKSCIIYLTKQKQNFVWSPAVDTARIAPKIYQGQPTTMYSECSRFHPNWFTFGGVIAERVSTAKLPRRVHPIFDRSLASSRKMNDYDREHGLSRRPVFTRHATGLFTLRYFTKLQPITVGQRWPYITRHKHCPMQSLYSSIMGQCQTSNSK